MVLNNSALFNYYLKEYEKSFSGWNFSVITQTGRMVTEPMKWSYTSILLPILRSVNYLLDMGTGGGEYLELLQPLPANTYATEQFEPNVPLATDRLKPYGVTVIKLENDTSLPFEDNFFDLIINRHESYDPKEVYRILKPEGYYITQQVGENNFKDMNQLFYYREPESTPWNVRVATKHLKDIGFNIQYADSDFPKTRFYDLGAVLYYLKAIPWQIEGFTISKYQSVLKKIFEIIEENGYITFTESRFIIKAIKNE